MAETWNKCELRSDSLSRPFHQVETTLNSGGHDDTVSISEHRELSVRMALLLHIMADSQDIGHSRPLVPPAVQPCSTAKRTATKPLREFISVFISFFFSLPVLFFFILSFLLYSFLS
jgi:hypothetical protein